jgi:integrase
MNSLPLVTLREAMSKYQVFQRDEKGNKLKSTVDTRYRLEHFFIDRGALLDELTPERCEGLYEDLRTRHTPKLKDRTMAVDTHRNMLAEAKTFLGWCVKKKWLRENPLAAVEGKGKRRHGKAQLRRDEARKWLVAALEMADEGDVGAVGAMTAFLLALRANEVVSRLVRDLDDGGQILWIPDSKTPAGRRTLEVPDLLRPYLLKLAEGRGSTELLFGEHWRDWVRKSVGRVCERAKVMKVTAHGMRGLHSTLAVAAGISSHLVAAAMGHESARTTFQSYALPEAVSGAEQRRLLVALTRETGSGESASAAAQTAS